MIGLAIIIVLLVLLLPQALFIVPQQNVYIIERLGKFNRTVGAGLNIKIPFFETIAAKVDMRTRQEQFGIDAKTRDNVTVTMAIAAQYRVSAQPAANGQPSGVWRSYYMLANPTAQMRSYLIDALRSSVPQYTLDEVFDKKDAIASDVNQTVSGLMVAYGYDVVSTLITSIDLPADVEQSMNRINSAQREKEAAQSLAEAERIKVVTEARARAEAMEQAGPRHRRPAQGHRRRHLGVARGHQELRRVGGRGQPAVHLHPVDRHDERVRPQRPPVHRGAAERLHGDGLHVRADARGPGDGRRRRVRHRGGRGEVAPLSRRFELPCAVRGLSQKGAIISLAPRV